MRLIRRGRVVVGVVAISSLTVGGVMVGCTGDDTVVTPDAGDAGGDVFKNDVTNPDTGMPDAADAGTDASDAPYDANNVVQFVKDEAQAYCTRLANCCFGADAAAFNMDLCLSGIIQFPSGVFEGNSLQVLQDDGGVTSLVARDKMRVDPTASASCLAGLQTITCAPTVAISATEYKNVTQNCYGAIHGIVPIGSVGCMAAEECVTGAYCEPPTDGGTEGTCRALKAKGDPCSLIGSVDTNAQCAYRGYIGSLRCDAYDYTEAGVDASPPSGTCQPQTADNGVCNQSWECNNGLCLQGPSIATCAPSEILNPPEECTYLTK